MKRSVAFTAFAALAPVVVAAPAEGAPPRPRVSVSVHGTRGTFPDPTLERFLIDLDATTRGRSGRGRGELLVRRLSDGSTFFAGEITCISGEVTGPAGTTAVVLGGTVTANPADPSIVGTVFGIGVADGAGGDFVTGMIPTGDAPPADCHDPALNLFGDPFLVLPLLSGDAAVTTR